MSIVTDRIRRIVAGYAFTLFVCSPGGGGPMSFLWVAIHLHSIIVPLVSVPFWGYPGVSPPMSRSGPRSAWERGTPSSVSGPRCTHSPSWPGTWPGWGESVPQGTPHSEPWSGSGTPGQHRVPSVGQDSISCGRYVSCGFPQDFLVPVSFCRWYV